MKKRLLTTLAVLLLITLPNFTFATTFLGTNGVKNTAFNKVNLTQCLAATAVTIPAGGPYNVTSLGISGADSSASGQFRLAVYSADLSTLIAQGTSVGTFTAVDTWQEQLTITQNSQLISGTTYRLCMTDTGGTNNFQFDTQSGGGSGTFGYNSNGGGSNTAVAGFSGALALASSDNTDFMFRIGIDAATVAKRTANVTEVGADIAIVGANLIMP